MSTEKISFSLLSVETILELANQCIKIISAKHFENPLIESSLEGLKEPIKKVELAIANDRKQEFTERVNNADFQRDQIFIGFRKYIEVFQYKEWDQAAKRASNNLLSIIRKHGAQLYKEGLTKQSSLMNAMFTDLEDEKAQLDIEKLGVSEWLIQLKRSQERFSRIFQQYNEIESDTDIPTKSQAKASLVKSLSSLLDGIEFLAEVKPDIYSETSTLIEEIAEKLTINQQKI